MGVRAEHWMEKYRREFSTYEEAAIEVEGQIREIFKGAALNIHLISARAKSPDSVSEKIVRQAYGDPARKFDDLLGVRVITLFEHSVEPTILKLRAKFNVDENRSVNKTESLGLRQVGYRSQHLVLKVRKTGLNNVAAVLKNTYVEVQVRSVLSHAWAEIEHSLRYKIGEGLPKELGRRFDAVAGTLELVDREFSGIEKATVDFVSEKSKRYRRGEDLDDQLSTVQLLGILDSDRPNLRRLGPDGLALPIEMTHRLAKIMISLEILTVADFRAAMTNNETMATIDRYSEVSGIDPDEASGIVILGAVIGRLNKSLFVATDLFSRDAGLLDAVETI